MPNSIFARALIWYDRFPRPIHGHVAWSARFDFNSFSSGLRSFRWEACLVQARAKSLKLQASFIFQFEIITITDSSTKKLRVITAGGYLVLIDCQQNGPDKAINRPQVCIVTVCFARPAICGWGSNRWSVKPLCFNYGSEFIAIDWYCDPRPIWLVTKCIAWANLSCLSSN